MQTVAPPATRPSQRPRHKGTKRSSKNRIYIGISVFRISAFFKRHRWNKRKTKEIKQTETERRKGKKQDAAHKIRIRPVRSSERIPLRQAENQPACLPICLICFYLLITIAINVQSQPSTAIIPWLWLETYIILSPSRSTTIWSSTRTFSVPFNT